MQKAAGDNGRPSPRSDRTAMAVSLRPGLERRLRREVSGDVFFDRSSRGRYATDASHYQMTPLGVVVPRSMDEASRALAAARDEGVPVTPRGGGTSQCGQAINDGLGIDGPKHLPRPSPPAV